MYDTGVLTRVGAFDAEHGDHVVVGHWIYFVDGAVREVEPSGPLIDPPADAFQLWSNIARYRTAKLERAVEAFDKLKAEVLANSHAIGDERPQLARLKAAQGVAQDAKREYERAAGYRDDNDPRLTRQVTTAQQAALQRQLAKQSALKQKIAAIEV